MIARMAAIALVSSALASCAQVTSIPLNMDGSEDKLPDGSAKVHGIRYYMPKPYLIVAELPAAPFPPTTPRSNETEAAAAARSRGGGGENAPSGGGGGDGKKSPAQDANQPQTAAPSAPTSDTSFATTMATYSMKLIYLPDYSQPMALQVKSGLFGSVSAAPTLQDGWMLGSVASSIESGTAAALNALAGFKPSSAAGGGGGKGQGGVGAAVRSPQDDLLAPRSINPKNEPLENYRPEQLRRYGESVGQGKSQFPPESDLAKLGAEKLVMLMKAVETGLKIRSALEAAMAESHMPTWGANVLPAGLYAFDYVKGVFRGLRPVMYFCKDGVQAAGQNEEPVEIPDAGTGRKLRGYLTPCRHD